MKIAVTGKGGVGKTTFASTLARLYAEEGKHVLAKPDVIRRKSGTGAGLRRGNPGFHCSIKMRNSMKRESRAGENNQFVN